MSAAQRYAHAAYDDGLTEDTIRALASLATWGKHKQNTERDLHRWFQQAYGSKLRTWSTVIEAYNPDRATTEPTEIPILLASDVLHSIYGRSNAVLWDVCIGATASRCKEYWDYAASEWAQDHPVVLCLRGMVCNIM